MKNKLIKLTVVAAFAVALTQTVQASPITGAILISGVANVNASTAAAATEVVTWGNNTVGAVSPGSSFVPYINPGDVVALASPWFFNSGSLANFWSVDGFTFNLSASSIFSTSSVGILVVLAGTVTGHGFDATAFSGSFSLQNPSFANGNNWTYSESMSFNSVPDGGTTVLLLGAALSGLALLKRKFVS